ncbi:MAG: hypothetical protein HKN13_03565, partial [Rhodothermales bacterium]|nr:hypothetical protein [Rhodothermales bacterium]
GVMVMIRPRVGDFTYSDSEISEMRNEISEASEAGADGVVFGVVNDGRLDVEKTRDLVRHAIEHDLQTTFHRAFDCLKDPLEALESVIDLGVDRILTSGTAWGSGFTTVDGLERIERLVRNANNRIEIVLGGGISSTNVQRILSTIETNSSSVSVHAFSSLHFDGLTNRNLVAEFVREANRH